jgi:alkaline phosphatase
MVCRNRDELLQLQPQPTKALGAFASSHLPFTIDRDHNEQLAHAVPTLAEMTTAALGILSRSHSDQGFLLQVEGGRVDHAAHANDAAAMLHDQLAFDDAITVVLDFQGKNPDTLVVITTDHGTANPGLNGMGRYYGKSTRHFEKVAAFDASFEAMGAELDAAGHAQDPSADVLIDMLRTHTGLAIDKDDAQAIADALAGRELCEISRQLATIPGIIGQVLGNHIGIQWTGITHTADWVLLMAVGPGSERFCGLHPCTDAFVIMTELLGIDHRNPAMTAEEARRFAQATRADTRPHRIPRT